MLSILGILFFLPHIFSLQQFDPYTNYSQLNLPPGAFGPESVALDRFNQGPYVGVSDGRILKYSGFGRFVDFAYASPNRTKILCDGATDINLGPKCGRPYGFSLDRSTGNLYVVDAYGGLYRVGPKRGLATLLATNAKGVPFTFLNGIDFSKKRNALYFTDASLTYTLEDGLQGKHQPRNDSSGRLLKYNIRTKQVRVLLHNLTDPVGPAVSADGKFVLISSSTGRQVLKYWLVGPKAGTGKPEVLLNLPGFPMKIKRAPAAGSFWVAVNVVVQQRPRILESYGYKFNSNGEVVLIKNLTGQYYPFQVNMVQEYDSVLGSQLFIGSRQVPYVGIYRTW